MRKPKTTRPLPPLSKGAVEEIVDTMLRKGFSEQARDLETHLKDIHERLVRLETRRGA